MNRISSSISALRISGIGAVCALLAACADPSGILTHARPTTVDQLNLSSGLSHKAEETHPGAARAWWHAFRDPQLDALMNQALTHNPDLTIALARIRRAEGLSEAAGAVERPSVDLDANVSRAHWTKNQFFPPPFGGSTTWNNQLNLSASYSLDLWGKNRATVQAAEDRLKASVEEHNAAALLLSSQLVSAYLHYAADSALLRTATERQAEADRAVQIEQVRLDHGLTDATHLYAAQLTAAQYREDVATYSGDLHLRAEQIAVLTGQGTATNIPLQPPTVSLGNDWSVPHDVPANLIGSRPDIRARRLQMEAAAEDIHVARAAFYPDINLAAYVGGLAALGGFARFLQLDSAHYGVTPALSLPIFDGGQLRGQLRERTAAYDESIAKYNKALLTALQQTASALTQIHTLAERREALNGARRAADADEKQIGR
ncbi:MAG: efflux transporter outer membrane subunit, partial [Porticoccaceae bacterium]